MPELKTTPHTPLYCERHDGPPVLRAEDSVCCEHSVVECRCSDENCDLRHAGMCCYCGGEGEWLLADARTTVTSSPRRKFD